MEKTKNLEIKNYEFEKLKIERKTEKQRIRETENSRNRKVVNAGN